MLSVIKVIESDIVRSDTGTCDFLLVIEVVIAISKNCWLQWRRQNFVSGGTGLASQKDRKE